MSRNEDLLFQASRALIFHTNKIAKYKGKEMLWRGYVNGKVLNFTIEFINELNYFVLKFYDRNELIEREVWKNKCLHIREGYYYSGQVNFVSTFSDNKISTYTLYDTHGNITKSTTYGK